MLDAPQKDNLFPIKSKLVSLQFEFFNASHKWKTPWSVQSVSLRSNSSSLQFTSLSASLSHETPISPILLLPPRFNLVSLQFAFLSASRRCDAPWYVM